MHSLDERFDRRLPLSHPLVRTLGLLREYRGKEELYRQQMPQALETLKPRAEKCGKAGMPRTGACGKLAAQIGTVRNK